MYRLQLYAAIIEVVRAMRCDLIRLLKRGETRARGLNVLSILSTMGISILVDSPDDNPSFRCVFFALQCGSVATDAALKLSLVPHTSRKLAQPYVVGMVLQSPFPLQNLLTSLYCDHILSKNRVSSEIIAA